MDYKDLTERIAKIHNSLAMVNVNGESVLFLADAMMQCRDLVNTLQTEMNKKDKGE